MTAPAVETSTVSKSKSIKPDPLRDPKKYFDGRNGTGAFRPDKAAAALLTYGPIGRGNDARMWVWLDGVWRPDDREIHERLVDILDKRFTPGRMTTVVQYLKGMRELPVIESLPVGQYINFRNVLLDWKTGTSSAHHPAILSTVQLAVDWNPEATCPNFLEWLATVVDADSVPFVQELVGYMMFSGNPFEKAFMLIGAGRNGKGTFLSVISSMLGKPNLSGVRLQQMSTTKHRFAIADLYGRLANIAGDLDSTRIEETGDFKMVIGNDEVRAEHKGASSFMFKPFATHIFSANVIPTSTDTTSGYLDKWIVLKFPNYFGDRPDTGLKSRLSTTAELEGVAAWGINGLQRLMARGHFDLPPSMLAAKSEFELAVDPVRGFMTECATPGGSEALSDIYPVYLAWCHEQSRRPLGKQKFNERIASLPGITKLKTSGIDTFKGMTLSKHAEDFPATMWSVAL
ncbi:MAG: phage/plasmid primase, P4 family [Propionibacteriales bacterium]|nr:phage/plasmid primase, P4 family [Propionibacteriales bacterium]